ncbi:MAG: response regulator [Syntrophobacteraceae bacterium]
MKDSKQEDTIVLIADDDGDDCLLIRDALIDNGLKWDLRFVSDGIELMEYLNDCERKEQGEETCLPSLVLLDLNMPRKGGREVLREINGHSKFRDIPVVILTTSDEPQDMELCRSLGAKLFITKPNMYNEWLEKLNSLRKFV